jgi:ABC-type phosphate transport system substrate-binding protein
MAVDTIGNQAIQLIAVDDPKSGTVFHFKEDVLNGKPFPAACKRAETFLTLTKLVAQTEGSVGFCHTRDIEILQKQGKGEAVKALSLKRDANSPPLAPVRPASGESSYPLMRPYYLYWNANVNSPLTREFVDFCNTN